MKKFIFFILSSIVYQLSIGQTVEKEVYFTTFFYSPYPSTNLKENLIKSVGANKFMVLKRENYKDSLILYSDDLSKIYSIPCFHNPSYKNWYIDEKSNELIIVQRNSVKKKELFFEVSKHNLSNGSFISKGKVNLTLSTEFVYFEMSNNHGYMVLTEFYKKNKEYKISLYDSSFRLLTYKIISSKSKLKSPYISNSGTFFYYLINQYGKIELHKINKSGESKEYILDFEISEMKEDKIEFFLNEQQERIVFYYPIKEGKKLIKHVLFSLDFNLENNLLFESKEFTEEYVDFLYNKVNLNDVICLYSDRMIKNFKPEKNFSDIVFIDLLFDQNGFLVISECQETETRSSASPTSDKVYTDTYYKEILLSYFNYNGKNVWNSIIIKKVAVIENSTLYEIKAFNDGQNFFIITCEGTSYIASHIRKIDPGSGKVSTPHIIKNPDYYTTPSYIEFIIPDKLIMVTTGDIKKRPPLILKIIDIKEVIQEKYNVKNTDPALPDVHVRK